MHELVAVHDQATTCAEELVAAIIANKPADLEEAAIRQAAIAERIDEAEGQRRVAEGMLVASLVDAEPPVGECVNTTWLLTILPTEMADELRRVRHDLLLALVRLQAMNRQAALLLHRAQAVMLRLIQNATPTPATYLSTGQYAAPAVRSATPIRRK